MKKYDSFFELAKERFSVRQFRPDPIDPEKLQRILTSAQFAPTAGNFQPQHIVVVQSEEARKVLQQITPGLFHAPCALIVCWDINRSWKNPMDGYDSGQDEAAIVATHLMFTAWELGIGSVWVRGFDSRTVAGALGMPSNLKICAMLSMGYPADKARPSPMHYPTKELDEMVSII